MSESTLPKTVSGVSSEVESLQKAIQLLLDGTQELLNLLPSPSDGITLRTKIVEYGKYAGELLSWCGKMPAPRLREIVFSLVKKLYGVLTEGVREGHMNPPEGKEEPLLPHIREILIELGPNLTVSHDRMAAFVLIPSEIATVWSVEDLKECLRRRGIVYGVDDERMEALFKNDEFDRVVRVALGKTPVQGSDAILEDPLQLMNGDNFYFQKVNSKADFKNQNLFVPVTAGQLILKKHPAKVGENGCDIYGREIVSPTGLDVPMPKIDHCERDSSGDRLISKVDGCAYAENHRIVVTPALAIQGNVDFETGNINTNVSVTINRDVLSTFCVESGKDIAVRGVIDAADIHAKGSVFCLGGINGKEKASIIAGKNVEAAHVNGAKIVAGGCVTINGPIIKSEVSGRRVCAKSANGQIMGGCVHAWEDICATEIGSEMGVRTELVLGCELDDLKKKVDDLSDQLKSIKYQKSQAEQTIRRLQKAGAAAKPQIEKLMKSLQKINKEVHTLHTRFDRAMKDLTYSESCTRMVRAEKVMHAGTHIRISNRTLMIKKQRGPTTIVFSDDKLVALPFKERFFNGNDAEDLE